MIKVAEFAHQLILMSIKEATVAVDMTVGRGNDTLFLARIAKKVIGFDIQEEAIGSTRALLEEHGCRNVELHLADHIQFDTIVFEPVDIAIYNLGYLPSGAKTIMTQATSTIASLQQLLLRLTVGGVVSITCYPKHNPAEASDVLRFCQRLEGPRFDVVKCSVVNKELAPFILQITKIKDTDSTL
ncbi:MAG: methyltransferase domain-containing protein [Bacillus subtilis]|nr:methyltransferase domain-containing protein [Bacillus subtilis]